MDLQKRVDFSENIQIGTNFAKTPRGKGLAETNKLADLVRELSKLHSDAVISEEDFRALLQLTLSEYVEQEIERRIDQTFTRSFYSNKFLNVLTGGS